MKILLYCTKDRKNYLYQHFDKKFMLLKTKDESCWYNGKIVGECEFEVEEIQLYDNYDIGTGESDFWFRTKSMDSDRLSKQSCLTDAQLVSYLLDNCLRDKIGYAIHIKNLVIYDKPKELSEYYQYQFTPYTSMTKIERFWKPILKAPQNMMFVHTPIFNKTMGIYTGGSVRDILISIKPKWLCKILNGEKTIEIRRKVLKEMINDEEL